MTETNMPPLPEGLYWKVRGCRIDGPDGPQAQTNRYLASTYEFPDVPPSRYDRPHPESQYVFEVVLCKDTAETTTRTERVTETYTEQEGGFWFGKSVQKTRDVDKNVVYENARKVNFLFSAPLFEDVYDDEDFPLKKLDKENLLRRGYTYIEYNTHWTTYRRYRKVEKLTVENIYKAAERAWKEYINSEHERALSEDLARENAVLRNKFLGDYPPKKLED